MKNDPNYEEKCEILKLYDELKKIKKRGRPKKNQTFTRDAID